jgi:GrpB-like predicted nucleotidyltransferase (UPF0157 family)
MTDGIEIWIEWTLRVDSIGRRYTQTEYLTSDSCWSRAVRFADMLKASNPDIRTDITLWQDGIPIKHEGDLRWFPAYEMGPDNE